MKLFKDNHVKVLDWSGNSPDDLNPIDNSWAIIKACLCQKDCTMKTKLTEAIIQVKYHNEKITDKCRKLVDSMPNRVKELLKNHRDISVIISIICNDMK